MVSESQTSSNGLPEAANPVEEPVQATPAAAEGPAQPQDALSLQLEQAQAKAAENYDQ